MPGHAVEVLVRGVAQDAAGWSLLLAQGRPLTSRRVCLRLSRFAGAAPTLASLAARTPASDAVCSAIDDWLFGCLLPHCVDHFEAIDDGEFDLLRHFAAALAAIAASGYARVQGVGLRRAYACLIKASLRRGPRSPRAIAAVLDGLRAGLAARVIGAATPGLGEVYDLLAQSIAAGHMRRGERQALERTLAQLACPEAGVAAPLVDDLDQIERRRRWPIP